MSDFAPTPIAPPIELGVPPPRVKRIRKPLVIGTAIGASLLVAYLMFGAANTTVEQEAEEQTEALARPGTALNQLPVDYAAAREQIAQRQEEEKRRFLAGSGGIPQLGPPRAGDVGVVQLETERRLGIAPTSNSGAPNRQPTPEEQALTQMRIERARNAQQVRESALDSPTSFSFGSQQQQEPQQPASVQTPQTVDTSAQQAPTDQDRKRDFVAERPAKDPFLQQGVYTPSGTFVAAGTLIPALFITGLNSDLPGNIVAQVTQPVYDTPTGKHVLIPQGTRLIGEYDSNVGYGQQRVLLVWTQLQFPNGKSLSLLGMPGVDWSGYAGVKDQVNNHFGRLIGGVVFGSLLSAATSGSSQPGLISESSFSDRARQGASQNVANAADRITQKNLDIQPTLVVRPGQRVAVFITTSIALPAYGR